jgi:hypothetical protein
MTDRTPPRGHGTFFRQCKPRVTADEAVRKKMQTKSRSPKLEKIKRKAPETRQKKHFLRPEKKTDFHFALRSRLSAK